MKKTRRISPVEILIYVFSSLVALLGLTMAVLGVIGRNLGKATNPLRISENGFQKVVRLNFQQFGGILIVLAAIIAVITLVVIGKRVDIEQEKQERRRQRRTLESTKEE